MVDGRQHTTRRHSSARVALAMAAVFAVAWVVKDLLAGIGVLHAVIAGLLTGACAAGIYWVTLRVIDRVGDAEDE